MPAPDWLEGLGGGLLGISKGLEQSMAPYKAYEGVRTQTLANDKSDVELRDFLAAQAARENPDIQFYNNRVAALDATNRETLSKGNANIYGIDTNLALAKYLADPNDAFQQGVQQAGLEPGTPEYASWLTEAIQMYNPQASVAANTAMKVPEAEQRNLSRQGILSYVTAYARTKDPGATAEFAADGTITVTGSDGERVTGLNPDILIRSASMAASKTPQDPLLAMINAQTNVAKTNADTYRASQTGQETPAQQTVRLNSIRVGEQNIYNRALSTEQALQKTPEYQQADEEKQAEMRDRAHKNTDEALKNLQRAIRHQQAMGKVAEFDATVLGAAVPGVTSQGGSSVTAPTGLPPREVMAGQAAGGGMGPWGASAAGPAYPTRAAANMANIESVVQAILNGAR